MKTIQVRNVPDEVHAELRMRAAAAGMSLSEYALRELAHSVRKPPVGEVLARARARVAASGGPSVRQIVETIREGRDAGR